MSRLRPGYGDEIRLRRTPLVPDGEHWSAMVYERGTLLYCVATGDSREEVIGKIETINADAKLPVVDAPEVA